MSTSPDANLTRRFLTLFSLMVFGLLGDVVLNDLNVHAFNSPGEWTYPKTIPVLIEPGADLRILKRGSEQITQGINPYAEPVPYPPPPFAAVFFYPFTLMDDSLGHLVQYWVLITLNLAGIVLVAFCLFKAAERSGEPAATGFPLLAAGVLVAVVALAGQFRGYGLEFSLERGNFDGYVLFLSAAGIACMTAWPGRVLVPVILFSAAAHLKIYPAILLLLPLLESAKRALVPLAVVNIAMFFAFGAQFAHAFLLQIVGYIDSPYVWPGNHSIASYVSQVVVPAFPAPDFKPEAVQSWVSRLIALLFIGAWAHGVFRSKRCNIPVRRWLLVAALSFPVMGALSSTSHDYKLVIYIVPVMVSLFLYCEEFLFSGSPAGVAGIILTLLSFVAINRSTILDPWPLLETKFPALCLLMLLVYLSTFVCRRGLKDDPAGREPAPNRGHAGALALAAAAICVAATAHTALKARGHRFAEEAKLRAAAFSPPPPVAEPPPAPVFQAPAEGGYGALRLRLVLPGTSAGIPEPIFVCGVPGNATLAYIRHLPDSQIIVGVEFWGQRAFESDPFPVPAPDASLAVTCSFPCLYPNLDDPKWNHVPDAVRRHLSGSYSIIVDDVVRLEGEIHYEQPGDLPRHFGINPLGGSFVSNAYTGTMISGVQIIRPPGKE